ncbi:MAG TPA: DUF4129 domain-containing protein [Chloroflexota bacterium]|nr:DUF4129 domain-containing protein [Chloroflexota bacterium]
MVDKVAGIRRYGLRIILLVVGVGWLLVGPGHGAAQQTVTLEAYLSAIAHYRSQILNTANDNEQCRETMTAVAHALSLITAVQFPDGSVMQVNHQGAAQALQTQPCNPARASQYLGGLCPNQLCAASRPLPSLQTGDNAANGNSLAGAAGATGGNDATLPGSPPSDMPPATLPPATTPAATTSPATDQSGPAADGEAPVTQPPATVESPAIGPAQTEPPGNEPPMEAVPIEATADGQTGTGNEQKEELAEDSTDSPTNQTGDLPGAESGQETVSEENGGEENSSGENGDSENEAGQSTPAATNTTASTSATATAVPIPPVATAAPQSPEATTTTNRWLLLAAAAAALVLIATAVALLLWPGKEDEEEPEEKKPIQVVTAVNEGRQLVEKGDYREAARRLFLAMLLALDEKGLLRFDRHRTNLELLQQERLHKEIVPSLVPIITTYERVWYGLEPLPATEYERLVQEIKAIRDWRRDP